MEVLRYETIPISKVHPDPHQPRVTIEDEAIAELAQNIQHEGVINPVEVDEQYKIVTGELRWRASKKAGLKELPVKVIAISSDERFIRQVSENAHHNTMTPMDTARALKKLLEDQGFTAAVRSEDKGINKGVSKLATRLGKSHNWIDEHLYLLEAPKFIQSAIEEGQVPFTLAGEIKWVPKEHQQAFAKKALDENLSRTALRKLRAVINKNPDKAKALLATSLQGKNEEEVNVVIERHVPSISSQIDKNLGKGKLLGNACRQLLSALEGCPRFELTPAQAPFTLPLIKEVQNQIELWLTAKPPKLLKS